MNELEKWYAKLPPASKEETWKIVAPWELRELIQSLLSKKDQQFKEVLEGLKVERTAINPMFPERCNGYNQAVSEINSRIDQEIKKLNPSERQTKTLP